MLRTISLGGPPPNAWPVVEVVASYVDLTPHNDGAYYTGLCPFHHDRTPSLSVVPAPDPYWHCFTCGIGGNAVDFVQRYEHCTYAEALERIGYSERGILDSVAALFRVQVRPPLVVLPDGRRLTWEEVLERLHDEPWFQTPRDP